MKLLYKNNNNLLALSGFILYTTTIISIIISQKYQLHIARIIYFINCFPIILGINCAIASFCCGSSFLLCMLLTKYIMIISLENLPIDFYFYISIDFLLHILFVFFCYINEQKRLKIIKRVIPVIRTETVELCSICLEGMETNIIKTLCNHMFHEKCLSQWTTKNILCPLCRGNLTLETTLHPF